MEEFFTRQVANEGVRLPLFYPDGRKSEHWLIVRGIDSDAFRYAELKSKRKAIELAGINNDLERASAIKDEELSCLAALIAGWSLDKELNDENVVTLLREAPQIADAVNRFAAKRSEFFVKKSDSSTPGSELK